MRATDGTTEAALKDAEERADEAENKLADERDLRQDYEKAERQRVEATRERDALHRKLTEVSVVLAPVFNGRMDPQAALAKIAEIVGAP